MEPIEVAVMAAVVLLLVPVLALRWSGGGQLRRPGRQLAIGVLPGVGGALIALLPRFDLLRDSLETAALPLSALVLAVLVVLLVRSIRTEPEHYDS
ncbi:MAG TPA: hypothetical protein VE395_04550 [Acidimicrobiales bacterium]|nr:hypothetical protein [Acidimicrobiales bacterium]